MFTTEHLLKLGSEVAEAWRAGANRDWTARAGTLEWSCAKTADHAVDTVFAPAIFLASRRLDGYPEYGLSTLGDQAAPGRYAEAVKTAVRVLEAVIRAAEPEARAVIWTRPLEVRGPEDFAARGALELILHAHDVCAGVGVAFEPSTEVCEALRDHTRRWPMWTIAPGWRAPTMRGSAWADLLHASGRA
jgi:hypothetical protein